MHFVISLVFAVAVTGPADLPKMSGPEIETFLKARPHDQKLEILEEVGVKGHAVNMTDAQIAGLYNGAGEVALLEASQRYLAANLTYEFVLLKQERINGKMNEEPDRMFVRFREKPRRVYAKWLKGGPHAGREVLYDVTKDPKHFKAHEGGFLNIVNVNLALDSSIARRDSNHSIDELGMAYLIGKLAEDRRKLIAAGLPTTPIVAKSVTYKGVRYWENVFVTPGPPSFYSAKARFLFDLRTAVPRLVEILDTNDVLLERYEYEDVKWIKLEESAWDPENPEYKF